MSDYSAGEKWQEAQAEVLKEEYRIATGDTVGTLEDAKKWFVSLPLAERDRVARRMNDPNIVGWHLQTPQTD